MNKNNMEEKLNLYQKIQAVSNEVRNITKDLTVGSGSYSYKAVQDLDVTLAVKDAERMHKVVSIPIKQELLNSEVIRIQKKNNEEGLTYVDTIKMTVRIVDLEDTSQFIDVESFGKGIDTGDKGFGKASTYARKYALLNAYKIATGEDPEAEKSKEITTAKTPSEKRVMVENYLDKNAKTLQSTLSHFNIGVIGDATEKQILSMYETLSAKGKLI